MAILAINNYSRLGKMGINTEALRSIAYKAVSEIPGAGIYDSESSSKRKKRKNNAFTLNEGVRVSLNQDGKAIISLNVSIPAGNNVSDICLLIQQKVAEAVSLSCDTIPMEVKVRVAKIVG